MQNMFLEPILVENINGYHGGQRILKTKFSNLKTHICRRLWNLVIFLLLGQNYFFFIMSCLSVIGCHFLIKRMKIYQIKNVIFVVTFWKFGYQLKTEKRFVFEKLESFICVWIHPENRKVICVKEIRDSHLYWIMEKVD